MRTGSGTDMKNDKSKFVDIVFAAHPDTKAPGSSRSRTTAARASRSANGSSARTAIGYCESWHRALCWMTENLLVKIPGQYIAQGSRSLPSAATSKDETQQAEVDVPGIDRVRLVYTRFRHKTARSTHLFMRVIGKKLCPFLASARCDAWRSRRRQRNGTSHSKAQHDD